MKILSKVCKRSCHCSFIILRAVFISLFYRQDYFQIPLLWFLFILRTLLHWNGEYVPLTPLFISFFLNISNVLKLLLSSNCNSTLLDSFWSMFIICSVPLILKLLQYSFPTIIPHSCWTFISKIQFISVKNICPAQYLTWRILQVGRTAERRTTKSGVF